MGEHEPTLADLFGAMMKMQGSLDRIESKLDRHIRDHQDADTVAAIGAGWPKGPRHA